MYRSPSCIHRVLLAAGLPILLSLTAMLSPAAPPTGDVPEASKIYVAPDGSDTAAGTRGAPLATLTAVRQKIRELKGRDRLPAGGVTVEMRGGRYEWTEPLELSAEDAGTAASPIVYRAFPGERVTIVGSRTINAWKPVTDPATLDRLAPGARGKVFQADLKALGVTEYGDLLHDAEWKTQYRHCLDDNQGEATQGDAVATRRLFRRTGEKIESRIEVFCDGYPMQLARWPNNGFTHIDKALGETKFDVRGLPGSREGIFSCVDDRPSRWTDEKDAMVRGYWFRDWVVQTQKIESIIPEKRIIKLAKPYHTYGGYRDGMWFFGFNLLCELDMPGEWYIDREADVLYFWPPRQMESALTEISVSDGLFRMVDTAHITLRGLRLEAARGTAV
ncbi:MAG: hypothetical protein HON70_13890, partial [Lentisphaerae bacterium]|nr:hypothetical protein [Lentisphaerota bacterium]